MATWIQFAVPVASSPNVTGVRAYYASEGWTIRPGSDGVTLSHTSGTMLRVVGIGYVVDEDPPPPVAAPSSKDKEKKR